MVKKTGSADRGQESSPEKTQIFLKLLSRPAHIFGQAERLSDTSGTVFQGPNPSLIRIESGYQDQDQDRKGNCAGRFFCPLIWITLFSGNTGPELYFNAAHSGVVMLVGLGYMVKCRAELERERRRRSKPAQKGGGRPGEGVTQEEDSPVGVRNGGPSCFG